MIKFVSLLKKPANMTRAEFLDWWFGTHAPLVRSAPGLRRYVISPALPSRRDLPYDGIAELWFDDAETARQVMNSDALAAGGEDLRVHGVEAIHLLTEETAVVGPPTTA